jgi:glycosyltransferase involved in cell wall biosynthesis
MESIMRVVLFDYVFDKPGITGLSDVVWNWARELVALGDEVHIVAPYSRDVRPPAGALVHRYPVPFIGYRNVIGHILIVLRGWSEIRKLGKIDLVQAPEYLSTGLFALLCRDTPVVLRVPGNIYERIAHANPFDWSMTQVLKIAARLSAKHCACVIVTSEEMRKWWGRTGTPTSRMVLIPTGVDTEQFRPIPDARSLLRLPEHRRIVLYVGRLSHEKGVQDLLGAFRTVGESFSDAELHLVGDGPLRQHLEQLAAQLSVEGRVIFHGWVDQPNLPTYYSAADITVLPSLTEGMPRTMIEALACGSPFLGTRITGIVDHVRDGETGFVVEPGDSIALAEKLTYILMHEEEAQRVGRQGLDYVSQTLGWDAVVRQYREKVYAKIDCF